MNRSLVLAAGALGLAACQTVETAPPVGPAIVSVTQAAPGDTPPGIGDRIATGRDFASRSAVVAPNAAAATAEKGRATARHQAAGFLALLEALRDTANFPENADTGFQPS